MTGIMIKVEPINVRQRPADIPQDVWERAWNLWCDEEVDDGPTIIGRAIMSERGRCAEVAERIASQAATTSAVITRTQSQTAARIAAAIRGEADGSAA